MSSDDLVKDAVAGAFRGVFSTRRLAAKLRRSLARGDGAPREISRAPARDGARNILFITVDQQRFDALSAHGSVARTPVIDGLARDGFDYRRAHVQSVTCMPSRSTMLTGQYPHTHGVYANGVPLPADALSIASHLRSEAGYRTALIGKAHFDPHIDPTLRFWENRAAAEGLDGPWHGFEHVEFATHGPMVGHHYAAWLWDEHREHVGGFAGVLLGAGGGDTGAPEVAHNPIPKELYHTDWVADRTLAWLREARQEARPWFCWMSFPDPHHPFDPPLEEVRRRYDWRDMPLPERWPESRAEAERVLRGKPRHWLDWLEGRWGNPEGGPVTFRPGELTAAKMREVQTMIHVENELIDDAVGRVLAWLDASDQAATTDVFYTSDHGDLQGDFGLLFKGPYHVDSLLQIPLIWRPAPVAGLEPRVVSNPVGHVDLAPTFCELAGIPTPEWVEGRALPPLDEDHERVLTTFDSQFSAVGMHLRTIFRDGWLCTRYAPSTRRLMGPLALQWAVWGAATEVPVYDGSEGELYDLGNDPHQRTNLWDDPSYRRRRDELLADMDEHLPAPRQPPLRVRAPA